jgi:hypothetical protein
MASSPPPPAQLNTSSVQAAVESAFAHVYLSTEKFVQQSGKQDGTGDLLPPPTGALDSTDILSASLRATGRSPTGTERADKRAATAPVHAAVHSSTPSRGTQRTHTVSAEKKEALDRRQLFLATAMPPSAVKANRRVLEDMQRKLDFTRNPRFTSQGQR